ncbi:MAG: sulfotransferase [Alphaproteobacteria bacterium]
MTAAIDYKLFLQAGMPRAASMWVYNVGRVLLREAGLTVVPEVPPPLEDDERVAVAEALAESRPGIVWAVKSHLAFAAGADFLARTRIVTTVRDPRAAVLSLMRFTRCDFATAVAEAAGIWPGLIDHYFDLPDAFVLKLRYEAVVEDPAAAVRAIAGHLGVPATPVLVASLCERFSRENVRRLTEALGDTMEVPNADGTLRRYDPATAFQTGHVSGRPDEAWQSELTGDQIVALNAILGPLLRRYGYPV